MSRTGNVLPNLEIEGFPKLKHLDIRQSFGLQHIVNCTKMVTIGFPLLESLILVQLTSLVKIWHGLPAPESLNKLRELRIENCNELKNIFKLSMVRSLLQLEKMEVSDCKAMESIVVEEGDCGFDENEAVEFPRLRTLKLKHLPQLKGFVYKGCELGTPLPLFDEMVTFPCLEELIVVSIGNIETIWPNRIAVGSLRKLTSLYIESCNGMEGIIVDKGDCGYDGNEAVEFLRLSSLNLFELPQLKGFVYEKNSFSISETAAPPGYSEIASSYELGTQLPLFNKMVAFPCLEQLRISSIGNIGTIWPNQMAIGSLSKLTSPHIYSCNAFPYGNLERFQKLKSLEARNCLLLEEIYQFQDLNVEIPNGTTLTFELKKLNLQNLPKLKNVWRSRGRFFTFQNLESIYVSRCEALKNIFPPFIAKSLPQLQRLCVNSCGAMEEMVAKEESVNNNIPCFLFPQLTSLELKDLREMRRFYPGRHTLEGPKLKHLSLECCHKASMLIFESSDLQERHGEDQHDDIIPHDQQPFLLAEKVFPNIEDMSIDGKFFKMILHLPSWTWYLRRLTSLTVSGFQRKFITISQFGVFESMPNLQKLNISYSYLKELYNCRRVDGDKTDSATSLQLSIKVLKLDFVKSLKHIWRQDSQMDPLLQYLETLELESCEDLISLAPSSYASFQNLTSLKIWRCNQMINLMKPSIAKTMANLVNIKIQYCGALKEIVVADDGQDDEDQTTNEGIIFNKLKTLELYHLESLMGFCMSSCYSFHFPCLEEVFIERCPNMRIFCHGVLDTPKIENWQWEGDLNATINQRYEEMIGIQQLRKLRLSRIPLLKERWHGQLPLEFFHFLYELVVDKLALFSSAIPSNLLPFLNNLLKLVVEQCDLVEGVFDLDGLNATQSHVGLLSKLGTLELIELPKLRHVWNKDPLGILGIRNLRKLKVHRCGSLTNIFTLPMAVRLVNLRYLEVKECTLVKVIVNKREGEEAEWDHKTMFPSLESIKLEHLPSLVNFYSGGHVIRCPSLRVVDVIGCPKMVVYGCSNSSRGIVERHEERPLEGSVDDMRTLHIFNDEVEILSLKELLVEWNCTVNEIWHSIFPPSFLCTLEVIQLIGFPVELSLLPLEFLHSLPNLKKFVVGDSFSERIFPMEVNTIKEIQPTGQFAQLQKLKLFNLPNLKHMVEEDSQLGSLFQHLKKLEVIKCSGLTRLITSFMAKGLVKLMKMVIKECERMTEIVASEANEVETNLYFNQLKHLELHGLPCLTSFSSKCVFKFPYLEKVIVRECPKMTSFAQNGLRAPLLDEVQIGEDDDARRWEDNLNNTIEKLFMEMNVQDVKEDGVALLHT